MGAGRSLIPHLQGYLFLGSFLQYGIFAVRAVVQKNQCTKWRLVYMASNRQGRDQRIGDEGSFRKLCIRSSLLYLEKWKNDSFMLNGHRSMSYIQHPIAWCHASIACTHHHSPHNSSIMFMCSAAVLCTRAGLSVSQTWWNEQQFCFIECANSNGENEYEHCDDRRLHSSTRDTKHRKMRPLQKTCENRGVVG